MMEGKMDGGKCKCMHHVFVKIMVVLVWISALGFWWATAFKQSFWWIDGSHFFMDVVILAVLMYTTKYCGCCGWHNGMCAHGDSCKCGDCGVCK